MKLVLITIALTFGLGLASLSPHLAASPKDRDREECATRLESATPSSTADFLACMEARGWAYHRPPLPGERD